MLRQLAAKIPDPPSDFIELFRTNANNTMASFARTKRLCRVRVVAVDKGERARSVMFDLCEKGALPPAGWKPSGGWGFRFWPADYAVSFDPLIDDVCGLVAQTLNDRPPPQHICIEGALVWAGDSRFYAGFAPDPWHPGAYPVELTPLPM